MTLVFAAEHPQVCRIMKAATSGSSPQFTLEEIEGIEKKTKNLGPVRALQWE
jgi:hypothetical protein